MLSDNDVIKLLKDNPEKGIEKLMNTYAGLVYTIVYNKLSGTCEKEDMEECINDIFYMVYKNRDSINLEKGSMKAYLSVIAKRKSIDVFRKSGRKSSQIHSMDGLDCESIVAEDFDVETIVADSETKSALINGIKELGEPDSEIFIRKYYFGQSTKQISKSLKIKENTVDKKVSRGLSKLKQTLGGVL